MLNIIAVHSASHEVLNNNQSGVFLANPVPIQGDMTKRPDLAN